MAGYQHRGAPSREPESREVPRYDPLVPIGDRYNSSAYTYAGRAVKIDNLQAVEDQMNHLHQQNQHLAQKIDRVAARLEELSRNGGLGYARGLPGAPGYYNGQGNAYYNGGRYLDGPNSASYLESVRRDDAERRGRWNDPTVGGSGGRTGGAGGARGGDGGPRSWEGRNEDKMETTSDSKNEEE